MSRRGKKKGVAKAPPARADAVEDETTEEKAAEEKAAEEEAAEEEAAEEEAAEETARETDEETADEEAPPPPRRGLRRSRPISVIPEVADVGEEAERRKRFFTRPLSGDSGVQSASGVRRRWRWFRPRSESRPPSDLTDTEARAEAARSAAAELRTRLQESDKRRTRPPPPIPPLPVFSRSRPPSQSPVTLEVKPRVEVAVPDSGPVAAPEPEPAAPPPLPPLPAATPSLPPLPAATMPPPVPAAAAPAPAAPAPAAEPAPKSPRRSAARAPAGKKRAARPAREPALRRWRRPLTELSRPITWQHQDLLVLAVVLALFAGGVLVQRRLARPSLLPTDQLGLRVSRPAGWLPPRRVGRPSAGLAAPDPDAPARPAEASVPYHVVIQSPLDPAERLEIRVAERPTTGNLRSALVLQRVGRHGEALWAADSTDRTIGGRDWVRTAYRYAFKGSKTDAPRIATGVEYATINGRLLYSVTLHGSDETAPRLEALLVPTLAVDANHPAAVGAR